MVSITTEIKQRMVDMRKSGATYSQICEELGVTKERCIAYLKDISPSSKMDAMAQEWQFAEMEAPNILIKMGFDLIHNLNRIASTQGSWDYLAFKENKWWLVDVTINGQKSISAKRDVVVDGYEHAILLKTEDQWKLIRITMNVYNTLKIESGGKNDNETS